MITLYHAQMTRSLRTVWLLEELGLDYRIEKLDFLGGDLKKPAYLAKNPLGRVPTLDDGEVRLGLHRSRGEVRRPARRALPERRRLRRAPRGAPRLQEGEHDLSSRRPRRAAKPP